MQRPWPWSQLPSGSLMRRALMRLQMRPKISSAPYSTGTPGDLINTELQHSLQLPPITLSLTLCVSQAEDVLCRGACPPLDGSIWVRRSCHHQESVQGEDEEVSSQAEVEGDASAECFFVILWVWGDVVCILLQTFKCFLFHRKQVRPCWPWKEWLCCPKVTAAHLLPALERVSHFL